MTPAAELAEILRAAPRNCWLALSEDETRVVAHGKTPDEATNAARAAGEEDPVLIWAPETWTVRVS